MSLRAGENAHVLAEQLAVLGGHCPRTTNLVSPSNRQFSQTQQRTLHCLEVSPDTEFMVDVA
jgi:hypothetical protein